MKGDSTAIMNANLDRQYDHPALDRHYAAQELEEICATCRYYEGERCTRENVAMTPVSWCYAGWRKKKC